MTPYRRQICESPVSSSIASRVPSSKHGAGLGELWPPAEVQHERALRASHRDRAETRLGSRGAAVSPQAFQIEHRLSNTNRSHKNQIDLIYTPRSTKTTQFQIAQISYLNYFLDNLVQIF